MAQININTDILVVKCVDFFDMGKLVLIPLRPRIAL